MWTNCLGGKQAGKYKTLGHILLHFKANYIHNIINLTYRRPTCKICATFKRLPGLRARELRVCRLRDLTDGTDIESGPFFGKNLGWQTE